jgi:peptidyl-prolyl cis-trans isomerase SurA
MMVKPFVSVCGVLAFLVAAACNQTSTAPPNVVARVNGVEITEEQLETEFARAVSGADTLPEENEQIQELKLQLLSDMINSEILLQLASDQDLTATDAEVDVQFNEFRSQYTDERFQELLAEQGSTVEDVRNDMRQALTIDKLINKEITSKISVSQAEIEAFYNANVDSFNVPEGFHVLQIMVTPQEDLTITNSTGDDATTTEEAAEKAQRLLRQIRVDGQDFGVMARQFSEDPNTAMAGGDLGFQSMDALAGYDPAIADAIAQMRVGETFPRVVATQYGYHILKLVDQDPGGQKDLSDPQVEAQARQVIFNLRDQLLRSAFFETVRNQARIENFYARRVLERTRP